MAVYADVSVRWERKARGPAAKGGGSAAVEGGGLFEGQPPAGGEASKPRIVSRALSGTIEATDWKPVCWAKNRNAERAGRRMDDAATVGAAEASGEGAVRRRWKSTWKPRCSAVCNGHGAGEQSRAWLGGGGRSRRTDREGEGKREAGRGPKQGGELAGGHEELVAHYCWRLE